MSSPLDLFPIASIVELHGLVSAAQHNGRRGVVNGATSDRLSVQLEPLLGTEIRGPLAVKPSNVTAVAECDVSLALQSMTSWVLHERISAVQGRMGTPEYDAVEHEALVKLQFKKMKKITKARPLK